MLSLFVFLSVKKSLVPYFYGAGSGGNSIVVVAFRLRVGKCSLVVSQHFFVVGGGRVSGVGVEGV